MDSHNSMFSAGFFPRLQVKCGELLCGAVQLWRGALVGAHHLGLHVCVVMHGDPMGTAPAAAAGVVNGRGNGGGDEARDGGDGVIGGGQAVDVMVRAMSPSTRHHLGTVLHQVGLCSWFVVFACGPCSLLLFSLGVLSV